jgi:hypothetical protein
MQRAIPYTEIVIDPMNAAEVQHWSKDLEIETYELRAAIRLVGPRLSGLRRFFGKSAEVVFLAARRADKSTGKTPAPPPWSAFPSVWRIKGDG